MRAPPPSPPPMRRSSSAQHSLHPRTLTNSPIHPLNFSSMWSGFVAPATHQDARPPSSREEWGEGGVGEGGERDFAGG